MKNNLITNYQQYQTLNFDTYLFGAIIAVVALALATLIAFVIYRTPQGNDVRKRKVWFWVLSLVGPVAFGIYNYLVVLKLIQNPVLVSKFLNTILISATGIFVLYLVLGISISFIFRRSKIGDWFFSGSKT